LKQWPLRAIGRTSQPTFVRIGTRLASSELALFSRPGTAGGTALSKCQWEGDVHNLIIPA